MQQQDLYLTVCGHDLFPAKLQNVRLLFKQLGLEI